MQQKLDPKKRIFITAPSYQDDELDDEKPKKPKIVAGKSRSSLLSKLPKASNDSSATMGSKLDIKSIGSTSGPSTSTDSGEPVVKPSKPMSTTMFMPNSTKNKLKAAKSEINTDIKPKKVKKEEENESDDDEPFFSFTSKEEESNELKTHKLEAGPSRPSRDLIRNQNSIFAAPSVEGEENMAVYGSTREPDEESAIAPYGSDISVYNQIAGPSNQINPDGSRKLSDAGLDIDGDAIRHLQGRKREDVNFIEAKVDASLGNIRENIRKGANQKHISTSMVDPLKQMKKSDPNAHVSKRTHQLKYLVELAKANETRLDQLWSNAKASNRSTAMKYGW